jgi:hypothetical protein
VPLYQFRAMVERSQFYGEPGKQRWAERYLWFQEHRGIMLTILGALLATWLGAVITALLR